MMDIKPGDILQYTMLDNTLVEYRVTRVLSDRVEAVVIASEAHFCEGDRKFYYYDLEEFNIIKKQSALPCPSVDG